MIKQNFKDIEKDYGKKEIPSPRRSKKQKKEEHEDSGRTVTLTSKKRMSSRYNKASVGKIVSIKNANKEEEEKEERILWCNSDSEESDLMYIKQKISNVVEIISPSHTGKSKNFEFNWEKILDKAHDVTIISESACSSDISFHQDFSTSLLDLYNLKRVRGDGNWLFSALCLAVFGDDSVHLFVRQYVWDYLIQHKKRFAQYMDEEITIDQYITKMMMEGEWGGHSEIVAFSEIYSVQIHNFDSIASQEPITRVVTAAGDYTISILFSGYHYDCLIPKNDDKANRNTDYNVDKKDLKNKSNADVKKITRNENLPNDYPTKYSNETLKSIFEYLKNKKYSEGIEEMRRKKNEIIAKNESTKN